MRRTWIAVAAILAIIALVATRARTAHGHRATVHRAAAHDTSPPLASLALATPSDALDADDDVEARSVALSPTDAQATPPTTPIIVPVMTTPPGSAAVEQTSQGTKPAPELVASFDGLGADFSGPQGGGAFRNPSDNSLAVGPNHIVRSEEQKSELQSHS